MSKNFEDFTDQIEKLLEKVDEITLNNVEITSDQLELLVGDPFLLQSLITKSKKETK